MNVRFEIDPNDPRVVWMLVTVSDVQEIRYKLDIVLARKMKRDLDALIPG
jgi:hypothetical protein